MFRLRMIGKIIRSAGLGHITVVFLAIFFGCAFLVHVLDPSLGTWFDAAWYCFQAVTTIGFGDIAVTHNSARIVVVCLSLISIFYLAVITGVVVAYCNELIRSQSNQSALKFMDQLEHLEDLSPEELASLSEQARTFRKNKGSRYIKD